MTLNKAIKVWGVGAMEMKQVLFMKAFHGVTQYFMNDHMLELPLKD